MPGDEDDWEFFVRGGELALKIKSALPWQSHVKHQAGRDFRQFGPQKVGNGGKQPHIKPERSQQTTNGGPKIWIVVDTS